MRIIQLFGIAGMTYLKYIGQLFYLNHLLQTPGSTLWSRWGNWESTKTLKPLTGF